MKTNFHGWLALHEQFNWSVEKISKCLMKTPNEIQAIFDELSQAPIKTIRLVPKLAINEKQTNERRTLIREMYENGWSIESLVDKFLYYSPTMIQKIVGLKIRKSRAKLMPGRKCSCGCKRKLVGRQKYATSACRQKAYRKVLKVA